MLNTSIRARKKFIKNSINIDNIIASDVVNEIKRRCPVIPSSSQQWTQRRHRTLAIGPMTHQTRSLITMATPISVARLQSLAPIAALMLSI